MRARGDQQVHRSHPKNLSVSVVRCQRRVGRQVRAPAATEAPGAGHLQSYSLSALQEQQIDAYIDELLEANEKFNLTAVREKALAYEKHVHDALSLLQPIEQYSEAASDAESAIKLLDVGSGGGLPGCMLAIARPSWQVCHVQRNCTCCNVPPLHGMQPCMSSHLHVSVLMTGHVEWLHRTGKQCVCTVACERTRSSTHAHRSQVTCLDSKKKKMAFVQQAARTVGLRNVQAIAARCEELAAADAERSLRECFDVVTARAVAPTCTLMEYTLPYLRIGGLLVALKGPHIEVADWLTVLMHMRHNEPQRVACCLQCTVYMF